jgi:ankyrin repeat protein
VASGADLNLVADEGRTALIFATTSGNEATVEYLIQLGANVDAADDVSVCSIVACWLRSCYHSNTVP